MKKLVILATPLAEEGHVNGCSGPLKALLKRGHRVIFVLEEAFKGTQAKFGFEEIIYKFKSKISQSENPGATMTQMLKDKKIIGDYTSLEKLKQMTLTFQSDAYFEEITIFNEAIKSAIETVKPDVIYLDSGFMYPAIYYSGIPFIRNVSTTPLMILLNDEVPPAFSGLPFKGNLKKHREFNKLRRELFYSKKFNDHVEKLGYDRYPMESIYPESQALTVYGYPNEINYSYVKKYCWFNLEVFNKCDFTAKLNKIIPSEFLNDKLDGQFSGKLIYVSLGSMGSMDLELMNRLLTILGKTNHKYIVSKGPRHCEFSLPRNMFGDRYLPQMAILAAIDPQIDLVITHGGNNTVTETFSQGKPMIVLPLFADQFDNAQRLHETGFGIRLDPYKFTEQEMVDAIDKLLQNEELKAKLENASKRIQASNRHEEFAIKIEDMFAYN